MISIAKNLDEYQFGKTAPEKMNHISCLILKHSQRLDILRSAYNEHCDAIVEFMSDTHSSGMTKIMKQYRREISEGFQYVHSECDTILKLTAQKTATVCADSLITKEQKALAALQDAAMQFEGKELKEETSIFKLKDMNTRLKQDGLKVKNIRGRQK